MDVAIADERILILPSRIGMDEAQAKAWTQRIPAFGTVAKVAGLLARPKDGEFELVYSEKRFQPFWRIVSYALARYERSHDYPILLAPEVKSVTIDGVERPIEGGRIVLAGHESCEEERRRQVFVDALTGIEDEKLAAYLEFPSEEADAARLAELAEEKTIVAPPQVKASGLIREAVAKAIGRIEADKVLEEFVELSPIDLCYRPVFAFRYRRAGKEAVIEVDGLTGEVKAAGSTFEQHLGKIMEPRFLLDIGAEAANLFIPGATVAKLALVKGLELRNRHRAAKAK